MRSFIISYLPFLLLTSMFLSCSKQTMDTAKMLKIAGKEKLPVEADYPGAAGVYLYQNFDTRVSFDKEWRATYEERYHQAVLYFNDNAADEVNPFLYLGPKDKLVYFTARTVKPTGEIIERDMESLQAVTETPEFTSVSGARLLRFTFTGMEKGDILEYSFKIKRYRRSVFNQVWSIQSTLPKLYSAYSLEFPQKFISKKRGWTFAPYNIRLPEATIKRHTRKTDKMEIKTFSYSWQLRDIPALVQEPAMPPYDDVAQHMRIHFKYKDWNALSGRYRPLLEPLFEEDNKEALTALARQTAGNSTTDKEKIENIFNYLKTNFRYVPTDLRKNEKPLRLPDEILASRYGDSRDLAILAVNMLRAVGVKAWPALVKTTDQGKLSDKIVSFDFNRMIIMARDAKGKDYWLDSACPYCGLGEVLPGLAGTRPLLLFDDGKSALKRIPGSRMKSNRCSRTMTLSIDDQGNIKGQVSLKLTGNFNLQIRDMFPRQGKDRADKIIAGYLHERFSFKHISNLTYSKPDDAGDTFHIDFSTTFAPLQSESKGVIVINPALFKSDRRLDGFSAESRKFPIVFNAPFNIKDIIKIRFDRKRYKIDSRPTGESMRQPFGHVRSRVDFGEDGTLTYSIEYGISKREIDVSDYEDFRTLLKTLRATQKKRLVLRKK